MEGWQNPKVVFSSGMLTVPYNDCSRFRFLVAQFCMALQQTNRGMMFQKSATPPDVCAPDIQVYYTSLHVTNFPPNCSTAGDKLSVKVGLVPRIFFILPSVCVHNNSYGERKTSEKQGRPGSMHHMRWMWLMSGGCDSFQVDVTHVRWMWLMSGGCDSCQVDVGGGATGKTMHWIIHSSAIPQYWSPDLSMIETTHLDR